MPRYYFHTVTDVRAADLEGTEFPDPGLARAAAVRFAGEMLRDDPALVHDGRACRVEVTAEGGAHLFTFTAAMRDFPAPLGHNGV